VLHTHQQQRARSASVGGDVALFGVDGHGLPIGEDERGSTNTAQHADRHDSEQRHLSPDVEQVVRA
jgi:hypothetical protein